MANAKPASPYPPKQEDKILEAKQEEVHVLEHESSISSIANKSFTVVNPTSEVHKNKQEINDDKQELLQNDNVQMEELPENNMNENEQLSNYKDVKNDSDSQNDEKSQSLEDVLVPHS